MSARPRTSANRSVIGRVRGREGAARVSVYEATVDPAERNTSHALILELVGHDKRVLDVGCASGYLSEALGKNGCTVSGIEYDATEAEKARPFLEQLVVADLNEVDLAEQFPVESFDVIVFGDVLEHLLDPDAVLAASLKLLRPNGSVVISIPNVAHGSVRLALLQGRWNYTPTGLLDRTHVRFVTYESLLAMLERAGLAVTDLRATVADPLATEVAVDSGACPRRSSPGSAGNPYAGVPVRAGGPSGAGRRGTGRPAHAAGDRSARAAGRALGGGRPAAAGRGAQRPDRTAAGGPRDAAGADRPRPIDHGRRPGRAIAALRRDVRPGAITRSASRPNSAGTAPRSPGCTGICKPCTCGSRRVWMNGRDAGPRSPAGSPVRT